MIDNRLDFISDIDSDAIEQMTELRKKFIELDEEIINLSERYPDHFNGLNPAAARAASLARTHIEIGLQFAIKTLCLCGENRMVASQMREPEVEIVEPDWDSQRGWKAPVDTNPSRE